MKIQQCGVLNVLQSALVLVDFSLLDDTFAAYTNSTTPLDVRERTLSCFGASAPVSPAIDRILRYLVV